MSPIALPAAALSPDCCAASMRLPASSIFLAMASMLPWLIVTEVPSGPLMVTSPAGALPPATPPTPIGPPPMNSADTAASTRPATIAQTMTTAV